MGKGLARTRAVRAAIALDLALALSFATGRAGAEPRSLTGDYSPYEKRAIADAEAVLGTRVDSSPEGKTIERVDFMRLDPFDPHDPLPQSVNVVHATSRVTILRHELVAREGDAWSKVRVEESARNLRSLSQLSLVICIAMGGSRDDTVRLVVITKDVWSLYVDFDLAATPGGLELLDLEPKETNVGGYQHTALARFILQPKSYSLGASYEIPRLEGRHLDLSVDGNVIIDRATGEPEGSFGSASITKPLWNTRTEWAWSAGINWKDQITRRYVNAQVATFTSSDPTASVPWLYRERVVSEQAKLTRSYGWENKNDFSIGMSLSRSEYLVPGCIGNEWPPPAQQSPWCQFKSAEVPVGEARSFPFAQWHSYSNDFLRTVDLDTLSLQEDARLGHEAWLRVYPVTRALGSTRDFLGVYGGVMYGVAWRDGLARASLESTVESQTNGVADASVHGQLGLATPSFWIGRLVLTASALDRIKNSLNFLSYLGGDSLLRGYPSRYWVGPDVVVANAEYRTRAFSLASIQIGGAAFYDVGDAFDGFENFDPKHSAGIGARIVFPQIERAALRLDFAMPISTAPLPSNVPPVAFFFAFNQAVTLPVIGGGLAP
jgi:hypothetical protein